jgi:outer membrane protein OmpA-like peptidoglycan-associated protein
MRRGLREDDEPNIWPVVVDVFVGFLVLVLVATLASYMDLTKIPKKSGAGTRTPPAVRMKFKEQFLTLAAQAAPQAGAESPAPQAWTEGFAELRLYFPAEFLFRPCEADIRSPALLGSLRDLLQQYDPEIERLTVTGHTDIDLPSTKRGSLCIAQGIHTNWQLSARRAIAVAEKLAPDDGTGVAPAKVWATARSSYEPVRGGFVDTDPTQAKQRDRRIEIWLKFREH